MPPYLNEELLDLFLKDYLIDQFQSKSDTTEYIHFIKTNNDVCRDSFIEWYKNYLIEVKGYSPANVKTLMNL